MRFKNSHRVFAGGRGRKFQERTGKVPKGSRTAIQLGEKPLEINAEAREAQREKTEGGESSGDPSIRRTDHIAKSVLGMTPRGTSC
ncbi:MAG: hypothetical protein DMG38_03120 [Acidobacteria bacterium]|nr:MAG: hypothetical protein DMG38_03120 [Acidobacteriota bacterium]